MAIGLKEVFNRVVRTLLQLVVAGGLTGLISLWANGLDPAYTALVLAGWQAVVTATQNYLEETHVIPPILK